MHGMAGVRSLSRRAAGQGKPHYPLNTGDRCQNNLQITVHLKDFQKNDQHHA